MGAVIKNFRSAYVYNNMISVVSIRRVRSRRSRRCTYVAHSPGEIVDYRSLTGQSGKTFITDTWLPRRGTFHAIIFVLKFPLSHSRALLYTRTYVHTPLVRAKRADTIDFNVCHARFCVIALQSLKTKCYDSKSDRKKKPTINVLTTERIGFRLNFKTHIVAPT